MASETEGSGKKIDLGGGPTLASKAPEKTYPTIYLSGLSKGNPLIAKDVGESCVATVQLTVTSKTQSSDGKWSVTLEVRDMYTKRSGY